MREELKNLPRGDHFPREVMLDDRRGISPSSKTIWIRKEWQS
jgi:hypothetical protein